MRKIAVFLAVMLIFLLPLTALSEEADNSSALEETPVQTLIRNSAGTVKRNAVLLIGGNPSQQWKDYTFDMYPHTVDTLTLESSLSANWISGVSSLSMFSPKGIVFCLSGEDKAEDVTALVSAFASLGTRVYIVSALNGSNTLAVNNAASQAALSTQTVRYVDAYSLMLNADGTVNTVYVGDKVTGAGMRVMAKAVNQAVSENIQVFAPAVSVPEDLDESEVVTEKSGLTLSSFKWLVPVSILVVGLIIGIDCARTAAINERSRKARHK